MTPFEDLISLDQGVVLLVDANSGVQAQTVANFFLALERGLVVVPAINKIDLPNAKPEEAIAQIESLFGIPKDQVCVSSDELGTLYDYMQIRFLRHFHKRAFVISGAPSLGKTRNRDRGFARQHRGAHSTAHRKSGQAFESARL